jgi:hypothetical protein
MAPDNVQVATGHALEPRDGDRVVGASQLGPILVSGVRAEGPFVALGFDPRRSDLVLRVAWPLLLLNVIDHFVTESTDYVSSYRTGAVWHVPVPGGATEAKLTGPSGATRAVPVEEGRAVVFGEHAGFYSLGVDADGATPLVFAANLSDRMESRVLPSKKLALGSVPAGPPSGFEIGVRKEWWMLLLLGALGLSLLEWLGYHRRVTV